MSEKYTPSQIKSHVDTVVARLSDATEVELARAISERRTELLNAPADYLPVLQAEIVAIDARLRSLQPAPQTPDDVAQSNPEVAYTLQRRSLEVAIDAAQQAVIDNPTPQALAKLELAQAALVAMPPRPFVVKLNAVRDLKASAEKIENDARVETDPDKQQVMMEQASLLHQQAKALGNPDPRYQNPHDNWAGDKEVDPLDAVIEAERLVAELQRAKA